MIRNQMRVGPAGGVFRRRAAAVAAITAIVITAGCGGEPRAGGGSGSVPAPEGTEQARTRLATQQVAGLGAVLSTDSDRTVYFAVQEKDGTIICTDACLDVWIPVSGDVTAPAGVTATIGTVERPDTSQLQLTYDGAPLYTFAEDGVGEANGHNLGDSFGQDHFSWRAVIISVAPSGESDTDTGGGPDDYGY
jgi:predicted lipoprotein with Yx(FWY)xxD motif